MNGGGKEDRESVAESFTSGHSSNDPKLDALNAFGTSRPAPVPEHPPATYQEPISEGYYPTPAPHAWNSDTPAYQDPPVQEYSAYSAYRPDRYQGSYGDGGYRR